MFSAFLSNNAALLERSLEYGSIELNKLMHPSQRFEAVILVSEDIGPDDPFPMECLPAMKGLWADRGVQSAIKRGNEYALHDNLT